MKRQAGVSEAFLTTLGYLTLRKPRMSGNIRIILNFTSRRKPLSPD